MRALLKFLSGLYMFYLLYLFLGWYIKGHFGKYFILFWAYTIITICFCFYERNQYKKEHNSRLGYEIQNNVLKNY